MSSGGRDARAPRVFGSRLNYLVPYNIFVLRCIPQARTPALPCHRAGKMPTLPGFSEVALTHLVPYNLLVLRCVPQARTPALPCHRAGEMPALPGFSEVALTHLVPYNLLVLRCIPQARTPALPCHRAGETPAIPCQCGRATLDDISESRLRLARKGMLFSNEALECFI